MKIEEALKYCKVLEDYYIDETYSLSEFINKLVTDHKALVDKYKKIIETINDSYKYDDNSYIIALLKELVKEV